jgi:hypothetical protein
MTTGLSPQPAAAEVERKKWLKQAGTRISVKMRKESRGLPCVRGKKRAVKAKGRLTLAREPHYVLTQKEHHENNSPAQTRSSA